MLFTESISVCMYLEGTGKTLAATWKVQPTKVGERVSARMTLLVVDRYSLFHLKVNILHKKSQCRLHNAPETVI